jgi:hypothetical protein
MANDRRPVVGIINTLQASGDNVFDDTTAEQWGLCDLNTDDPVTNLFELIPYGKTLKVESFAAAAEVQQLVLIGGQLKETIAASTRYKLEIHNAEDKYESHHQPPAVHAYSTGVTIPAADAARTLVYSALADKVNNYAGNNATAYPLFEFDYTAGTDTGDSAGPTIGAVYTQATSGATARVIDYTITSGTFAGDDAAGTIWLFDDNVATIADAAYNWTGETTFTITQTISTLLLAQGLAIEDDAGYFISNLGRPGVNWVALTQGFTTDAASVSIAGVYALGIGSVMAQLKPVYDHSKQEVVNHGLLEYEFTRGDTVDAAKEYTKVVITVRDGDQDAIDFQSVQIDKQYICYADESNGTNLTNFLSAIGTAAAK